MKVKDLEAASSDALGRVFGGLRTRAKVAMRRESEDRAYRERRRPPGCPAGADDRHLSWPAWKSPV